ncbi:MAG: response regulator, partial [Acidobacteria bacterium]|nr:response regulator [Acidobacteriota bacterium]
MGKRPLEFHCNYCSSIQHWELVRPLDLAEIENSGATHPQNILVVDDDDLTVKLLRKVLEAWEAHIEVAENGKEALAKLASGEFDFMVCDIKMTEMTGEELFQHIQENAFLSPL